MTFGDYWMEVMAGPNKANIPVEYFVGSLMVILLVCGIGFLLLLDDFRKFRTRTIPPGSERGAP